MFRHDEKEELLIGSLEKNRFFPHLSLIPAN